MNASSVAQSGPSLPTERREVALELWRVTVDGRPHVRLAAANTPDLVETLQRVSQDVETFSPAVGPIELVVLRHTPNPCYSIVKQVRGVSAFRRHTHDLLDGSSRSIVEA